MKQFAISFALVLAIISITASLAFVSVRNWSLSKTFEPPLDSLLTHVRSKNSTVRVISLMGDGSAAAGSLAALRSAGRLGTWIWLDLRPTHDDVWVALNDVYLERSSNVSGLSGLKTWSELQAAQLRHADGSISTSPEEKMARLNDIVRELPTQTFVLNFKEYRPGDDIKVEKLLRELQVQDRAIIQSDVQGLLNDLRTRNPRLVFGTGLAQLAKLRALLSMNLEGLLPLKGDVVFALASPNYSIPGLLSEVHRRQRPLFAGPAESLQQELAWVQMGADGVITKNPLALCRALRQQQIESCAKASE